jgi:hypothetical protein
MKYWQLSVCLSEEKVLREKILGDIDLIKHGKDDAPEQITIDVLSKSNEKFFVLSNNYLRSSNVKASMLAEMKCSIIETMTIIEGYKRYGDKITEVFDYGSLDLSSLK